MQINFNNEDLIACQDEWNNIDPEKRIQMSAYDLAKETPIETIDMWLNFLSEPQVKDQLDRELNLYKEAQQRKLIAKVNSNDKSVGTAQLISALEKTKNNDSDKIGNIIVYSYVPLNTREAESPQAVAETVDIFDRRQMNVDP